MIRLSLLVLYAPLLVTQVHAQPHWARHTIDSASRGADGVRLFDVNGDGRLDIVTGWEEGGQIRVCYQPSKSQIRDKWRCETVANVGDPEDAVAADIDGDGHADVVSASEGKTRAIHFHWGGKQWTTAPLPAAQGATQWMFTVPVQLDNRNGLDLIAGAKNENAALGWFEAPLNARDLDAWKWHPIRKVGWIMSIVAKDMDGDGDLDILFSDRKGDARGVYWLENTGGAREWREHLIGASDREVMFITVADIDGDGVEEVISTVKPREILIHKRKGRASDEWTTESIAWPGGGTAKAIRVADMDLDGQPEIVITNEGAEGPLSGVWMLKRVKDTWNAIGIGGPEGVKYDLIELLDLDGDGDLDLITCEERDNLGVVWYENPASKSGFLTPFGARRVRRP